MFGAVIIIRYLLSYREFKRFHTELKESINKLATKLTTISIEDVLKEMGFPPNWTDIINRDIKK